MESTKCQGPFKVLPQGQGAGVGLGRAVDTALPRREEPHLLQPAAPWSHAGHSFATTPQREREKTI